MIRLHLLRFATEVVFSILVSMSVLEGSVETVDTAHQSTVLPKIFPVIFATLVARRVANFLRELCVVLPLDPCFCHSN
jgi:hypothetical protein